MRTKSLVAVLALLLTAALMMSAGLFSGTAVADSWGTGAVADGGIDPANPYAQMKARASSSVVIGSTMYVGTDGVPGGGQVWKTTDGTTWTEITNQAGSDPGDDSNNEDFTKMARDSSNNLYVGTLNKATGCEVWRYNGTNWAPLVGPSPAPKGDGFGNRPVKGANEAATAITKYGSDIYVGTYNKYLHPGTKVYHGAEVYKYNGTAWTQVVGQGSGITTNFNGVSILGGYRPPGDENTAWAVGAGEKIYKTRDLVNWSQQHTGSVTLRSVTSLNFWGQYYVFAVGDNGTILRSSNGGTNWTTTTSGAQNLRGVACLPSTDLSSMCAWAVGDGGTIRYTNNGGVTWSTQSGNDPENANLRGVSTCFMTSPNRIYGWAVGVKDPTTGRGTILRYNGTTWSEQQAPAGTGDLNAVSAVNENVAYAVGDNGVIIKTENGGATWVKQASGTTKHLYGVSRICQGFGEHVLVVGQSATVLRTSDGGRTWKPKPQASLLSKDLRSVSGYFEQVHMRPAVAVGDLGATLVSRDGYFWEGPYTDSGFGDHYNFGVSSMAVYDDPDISGGARLYFGTTYVWAQHYPEFTLAGATKTGCMMFEYDGEKMREVGLDRYFPHLNGFRTSNGVLLLDMYLADSCNESATAMTVFDEKLYVGTHNRNGGLELWRYSGFESGEEYDHWEEISGHDMSPGNWPVPPLIESGFGDKNNAALTSMSEYSDGKLYATTWNPHSGCEVRRRDADDTWVQVNDSGFTPNENARVSSMVSDGTNVYAGTRSRTGLEVWELNGKTQINADGFGDVVNPAGFTRRGVYNEEASSMIMFDDGSGGGSKLYVGTRNPGYTVPMLGPLGATLIAGCELWRYDGGSIWTQIIGQGNQHQAPTGPGFGDDYNSSITSMAAFQGDLYVGTEYYARNGAENGFEIWRGRYASGAWTWTKMDDNGLKEPAGLGEPPEDPNDIASSMAVYNNKLYVGTHNKSHGCEVWYTSNGSTWYPLVGATGGTQAGFGDNNNREAKSMAVYGGKLYVGTVNIADGCEVWCYNGTSWTQVNTSGFGSKVNGRAASMAVSPSGSYLYVGTYNKDGGQVWRYNGSAWARANSSGFGDKDNDEITALCFKGSDYYAGTQNGLDPSTSSGCEVWKNTGTPGRITTVSPSSLKQGQTATITITGDANTNFLEGDTVDCGSGVRVRSLSVEDSDTIKATVDVSTVAQPGTRTVSVVPGDDVTAGQHTGPDPASFTVLKETPVITGMSPRYGPVGTPVTITGKYFGGSRQSNYHVTFNGVQATRYTKWTDTEIVCYVPSGATNGPVRVVTGGLVSNEPTPKYFTVTRPPGISSFRPTAGTPGTTVTIKGENFGKSRGSSKVKFNGVEVGDYPAWSDTQIKVKVPSKAKSGPISVTTGEGTAKSAEFKVMAVSAGVQTPTWYLAEGSTKWGFSTYVTIENPNSFDVTASVTYNVTGQGAKKRPDIKLPALSQTVVNPVDDIGQADFSTKVECKEGYSIAVDRRMMWTGPGAASPEGHSSIGVTAPAKTWYLPEGSSDWGFETWLLIQNPNKKKANCKVTYMIEGEEPQTFDKTVDANSRSSFSMEADIGRKDASIKVTADVPVIPERAMYRNNRREGHASIGTTSPARDYYLAEGSTNWGFTTYVLVQNPNDKPANVTVTYMTPEGAVPQAPFAMPPNSRKTVRVNDVLPGKDVSTKVSADRPIIAERAMYWDNGTGEACHDSIGMAAPHKTFYLPDGETTNGYETWTLVQNPNDTPVEIRVYYLTPEGGDPDFVIPDPEIPANSRVSFNMGDVVKNGRAAILVESRTAGKKIMVERAMYWNNRGAGTNTIGGFED